MATWKSYWQRHLSAGSRRSSWMPGMGLLLTMLNLQLEDRLLKILTVVGCVGSRWSCWFCLSWLSAVNAELSPDNVGVLLVAAFNNIAYHILVHRISRIHSNVDSSFLLVNGKENPGKRRV